jgi:hypothetical protein
MIGFAITAAYHGICSTLPEDGPSGRPANGGDADLHRCPSPGVLWSRSLGPSSIPSLSDGDMLDTAWIGFASRHAGPALPASTSSLVQHGCAAMLKPMIDIPLASVRCLPEALPERPETADTVVAA